MKCKEAKAKVADAADRAEAAHKGGAAVKAAAEAAARAPAEAADREAAPPVNASVLNAARRRPISAARPASRLNARIAAWPCSGEIDPKTAYLFLERGRRGGFRSCRKTSSTRVS